MMIRPLSLAAVVALTSCAMADKLSTVQTGMTKEQVVAVMGKPASVSRKGDTEYLNYALSDTSDKAFYGLTDPYFVKLVGGRVESFGRLGDFDSTKDPTANINTTSNSTIAQKDMFTELTKLKALLDSGAITKEEYEAQKKRILANGVRRTGPARIETPNYALQRCDLQPERSRSLRGENVRAGRALRGRRALAERDC